jgi:hypothetical protein
MEVRASLPEGVKGFAYEKNSHWIEFRDDDGNTTKLPATAVVLYECEACKTKALLLINHGELPCMVCRATVKPAWRVPELAFVPQRPSGYRPPPQNESDDDGEDSGNI